MTFTHSFVRRTVEAAGHALSKPAEPGHDGDGEERQINPIALLVIALTFLLFAFLMFTVG